MDREGPSRVCVAFRNVNAMRDARVSSFWLLDSRNNKVATL